MNLRHWALLTLLCSIALPQDKAIRKYLVAHLKLCSADIVSEEGKFARFAEKVCTEIFLFVFNSVQLTILHELSFKVRLIHFLWFFSI